jgi:hypothetical protein
MNVNGIHSSVSIKMLLMLLKTQAVKTEDKALINHFQRSIKNTKRVNTVPFEGDSKI